MEWGIFALFAVIGAFFVYQSVSGRAGNDGCESALLDETDGLTNPATGLPMMGGVDTAGNPYGIDLF